MLIQTLWVTVDGQTGCSKTQATALNWHRPQTHVSPLLPPGYQGYQAQGEVAVIPVWYYRVTAHSERLGVLVCCETAHSGRLLSGELKLNTISTSICMRLTFVAPVIFIW